MQTTAFNDLHLPEPIRRALSEQGFKIPTPIQEEAIPHLLAGKDLIGCAETGTGKTAAFAIPVLQRLFTMKKRPSGKCARVLVLTPTRELCAQVEEHFRKLGRYLGLRVTPVFGGVHQRSQVRAMANGVEVLVATPGRLLDLIEQKHIRLTETEYLILDEADRMLDMGFLPAIKKIISMVPKERQTLLFSATMESSVLRLAETILRDPVHITAKQPVSISERLEEQVMFVNDTHKRNLLLSLLNEKKKKRTLVFTKTKRRADQLEKYLRSMSVRVKAIHGNKSQKFRNGALSDFRSGRCDVLVATDVAARGIDVANITHVINFDLPNDPSNYIHRIGRTARAGANGIAHSFCGNGEPLLLRGIERLLKRSVSIHKEHPYHSHELESVHMSAVRASSRQNRNGRFGHRKGRNIRQGTGSKFRSGNNKRSYFSPAGRFPCL